MKTSNKLLSLIGLIVFSFIVFYNIKLKAEYNKGNYKNRFYGMDEVKIDGFNSIENNASNLNVRIEYGNKFKIYYGSEMKKKIEFKKNKDALIIDFQKNYNEDDYFRTDSVIIICPKIEHIRAGNLLSKKQNIDYYIPLASTTIYGFKQESLNLIANSFTDIRLENNVINQVTAIIGDSRSTSGILSIKHNNQINNLYTQLNGKSILNIENTSINNAKFNLSDSAKVNLTGRALKLLKN